VTAAGKIRVALVDDHPIVRLGLGKVIDAQPDMTVVAEAADGIEAVRVLTEVRPDVTLMDLRMPGAEAPQVIAQVLAVIPDARIIVLTTFDGDEDVNRAVRAGARGYLLKDTFTEGILEAIRHVHAGGQLFGPQASARLAERAGAKTLTKRETAVLELLARGLTNREIQASLSLREGTLKNHLKHIFEKLEVSNRTEAAHAALQRGFVRTQ
jgi:two-component system, NarL family, response regulator